MFPLDPATGPEESHPAVKPSDLVPAQAMTRGGTFVRPGAIAWGPAGEQPGTALAADGARETVEKALAAMTTGGHPNDLLDGLARARVWVPLPTGPDSVTDGSSVALPVITYLGADFVPCFTSPERLAHYAGPRPRADAQRIPHIVVPAAALARRLPPGLGLALNPGAEASVPIYPEGVSHLAGTRDSQAGARFHVGHPPAEPDALLAEVSRALRQVPVVVAAARAWLTVPGAGEGLVLSVTLEDPLSADAHAAVVEAVERAVALVPRQPGYPIDVTFPGEADPDVIDAWVADNTRPFYERAGAR